MQPRVLRPVWLAVPTVVLLLIAVGLHVATDLWRHERAVGALRSRGAVVETTEGGPQWLRRLIGEDCSDMLDRATGVHFSDGEFGGSFERVGPCLRELHELKTLDLSQSSVRDGDLANLRQLVNLERLSLRHTHVTGEGFVHLRGLSMLSDVDLSGSYMNDAGAAGLRSLMSLRRLDLDFTRVGDEALEHIAELAGLEELYLQRTDITDAGVRHLARLTNLRVLSLVETQVTDRGLDHLSTIGSLRSIYVIGSAVSESGASDFKRALPDVVIEPGWETDWGW